LIIDSNLKIEFDGRVRVHEREFQRFLGAYCMTNTLVMAVVVTQNMRGVPAWTGTRDTVETASFL
jgi:hypothetical protein